MSRGMKILEMLNLELPMNEQKSLSLSNEEQSDALNEALNKEILFAMDHTEDINCSDIDGIVSFLDNDNINLNDSSLLQQNEVELEENIMLTNITNEQTKMTSSGNRVLTPHPEDDIERNNNGSEYEPSVQSDVTNENESEEDKEIIEGEVRNDRRKKRKLSRVNRDVTYEQNKKKRVLGLPYCGKKKQDGKWNYQVEKPGKFLLHPCGCKLSGKDNSLQCRKLTENNRRNLFETFWKKSWTAKREYVRGLAILEAVKRRRGEKENSRRNYSIKYNIAQDLVRYRVCKKMFNATLGLRHNCVLKWIKLDDTPEIDRKEVIRQPKLRPNPKSRKSKESEIIKKQLAAFFDSLPKMESHYCRSSTQKLYLEPMWQSKQELYRFYADNYCIEQNLKPYSRTVFNEKFQDMNLSLFHPKKDQCDTCVAHKTQNITEEEYQHHLVLKQEARDEKNVDKTEVDTEFVFTMDLQSVLLAPRNKVGAMYYKMKLAVHNFTIYNIRNYEGYCYLWSEVEGALTANEFSSILVPFIEKEILPKMRDESRRIIFWSDGCTGQNRNSFLSNALLNTSMMHKVTIIQKYLFKGHTQMEADSMHSAIERRIRNKDINVPADYVTHCENARLKPFPYKVSYLEHSFFKDFSNLKYYSSVRPGRRVGDPTVTDLKQLKYSQDGVIKYKLRHTDVVWQEYNQRLLKQNQCSDMCLLPNLYGERRKIKKEKFDHLQLLKNSLKVDFHYFYDNIPHH